MSRLPVVSGKQCTKASGKIGFTVYRQRGSHITLVRETPLCQLTVPNHKTVAKGTLRSIIRQAELTVEEFTNLL